MVTSAEEAESGFLVFDIGGTTIRAAAYDPLDDTLSGAVRAGTKSHWFAAEHSAKQIIDGLVCEMTSVGAQVVPSPDVVSIGFPGPVAPDGTVLAAPTVVGDGREGLDLQARFQAAWPQADIVLANDVTAAGYAVARHAADSFCVVTVGSGVGCKVFLDGQPVLGSAGRGGEIGHLRVDFSADGNRCECGGRGHLGAVASGRGALTTARRRATAGAADALTCEDLVAGFYARRPLALEVIGEAAAALGTVLAGIHTTLGLERFVLTGGFALALGEDYRRLVTSSAARSCWQLGQDWQRMVELDPLEGCAGLLGAGRMARQAVVGEKAG